MSGKSLIVESIFVLEQELISSDGRSLPRRFFVPHVILNARFDTGMLEWLTKSR